MKYASVVVLAAAFLALASFCMAAPVVAVHVSAGREKSNEWLKPRGGSGVFTPIGLVTAGHVAVAPGAVVDVEDGESGRVSHVRYLKGVVDVALLAVPVGSYDEVVPISNAPARVGDVIQWWGADDDWRPEFGTVRVIAVRGDRFETTLCRGMGPGDSGGPVLSKDGRLVGILYAISRTRAYFESSRSILQLAHDTGTAHDHVALGDEEDAE